LAAFACAKKETAPLPAPFLVHHVDRAHFDWRWRERPALALLAWEPCRDPLIRLCRTPVKSRDHLAAIIALFSVDTASR
jgi:hypothetical protein